MSNRKTKSFSYAIQNELPPLPKIKTEWDFSLYYNKQTLANIEHELQVIEQAFAKFAKKYRNEKFLSSAKKLRVALEDYFALDELRPEKALRYYSYRKVKNVSDKEAQRAINRIQMRLTKAGNQLLFFPLAIVNLSTKKSRAFQKDPLLIKYRYYLEQLSKQKPHTLTQAEEIILQRKRMPARDLWMNATDTILGERTITYKKKEHSLLTAIERVSVMPLPEREPMWQVITKELRSIGAMAEHEFTAILLDKAINDDLRNYDKPYTSTIISYENDISSVEALVDSITDIGFKASRAYYTAKARAHGLARMTYTDRHRTLGELPNIPFTQAVEITRDVLYGFEPEFGKFFDTLLAGGHIDVYPQDKKEGGAFMASGVYEPVFVHLNHTDTFTTLETLAHEIGHAIHSYCSQKSQPSHYQEYSIVTAETASTFFEQLLFDKVYEQASDSERKILLEHKLDRTTATIMRQIAFFNYEKIIHQHAREHGAIENDTLASLLQKELQRYMGKSCDITQDDGYSYVYIGHFRRMFYVYTYAYGHLISQVMLEHYYQNPAYATNIKDFLNQGGSNTVENIYRSIGIEPTNKSVFAAGLKAYRNDVNRFRTLTQ